jgi:hypothetical protein
MKTHTVHVPVESSEDAAELKQDLAKLGFTEITPTQQQTYNTPVATAESAKNAPAMRQPKKQTDEQHRATNRQNAKNARIMRAQRGGGKRPGR